MTSDQLLLSTEVPSQSLSLSLWRHVVQNIAYQLIQFIPHFIDYTENKRISIISWIVDNVLNFSDGTEKFSLI